VTDTTDGPAPGERLAGQPQGAGRVGRATSAGEAVQAALLSLALTVLWSMVSPLARQPVCCDASEYLKLATNPTATVLRPYSMRVLVPWLVHALGGDAVTTFRVVSLVCLTLAAWLVYLLARRLGVGHWYALLALAALACSRGWLFFFYDPYLTEPAAFLLLAAAFLVLVGNRRTWLIAPLLLLLAATREQFVGFALPAYFWLRQRRLDWRAEAQVIGLLMPALLVFAALAIVPEVLPPTPLSQPMGFAYTLDRRMEGDGWLFFGSTFAMSLGVWWPLAVASLRVDRFRRLAWWLLPVLAYLVVIGWDWSRYALYAFPVVMPAGAWTIARMRHRPLLLALVALQAMLPVVDFHAGKPTLDDPGPSLPISLLLILATIVVLVAGDRGRYNRANHPDRAGMPDPMPDGPFERHASAGTAD
jgi:hypothetical protein